VLAGLATFQRGPIRVDPNAVPRAPARSAPLAPARSAPLGGIAPTQAPPAKAPPPAKGGVPLAQ
jgi:hypothetical protein